MSPSTTEPRARRRPRLRWIALPLVAATLTLAAGASAVGRYADRTGDSGSAPDITGVTVSKDAAGQITFTVRFVDLPEQGEHGLLLFVDSDLNAATGSGPADGADYVIGVDFSDRTFGYARWAGADWEWLSPTTVQVVSAPQSLAISINRSELGNTGNLNFWVSSLRWDNDDEDIAPENGLFNYSLAADGPDLRALRVTTKPAAGPQAGRTFVVTAAGLRLPPAGSTPAVAPRPQTVRCAATLAGKRIVGRGAGGCTLAIPATARGRQLVVVVTVTYQGATKSFRYAYRVR